MVLRKLIVFSWVVNDVLGQRRMSNREYESKLPDVPTPKSPDVPTPKSDIISMNADFTTNVAPPTNVVHPYDPATQKDVTADIAVATPDKVATAQGNSRGNKESSEEGNATEAKAAAYSAVTSGASMSDAMKELTTDTSKNDPIVGNVVTQTVAPIRFDSIVQFYVDKVTPLAISMDEFAYTQVGFCDVQKTNHYGNVNFRGTERLLESGGKHFHFIMGLNMTRAPVCSQQLSKDQTKALELLIDYQYYARYFIGERQTEARNATQPKATEKNPTITGEVSPLELEHFLGVRLDDMSDFLTFMKRHQSSTDVPADFKFGKRKFTEASYWVFTHKVFIIYYDPKTSKILDAVLEVNELQLVSPTTVMQIHHTVYWLPRDEAEFRSKSDNWGLGSWDQQKAGSGIAGNSDKIDVRNHRHVGPQGLDVDFEVHPTIVVLPLLLSIIVFILVKPNVALEATSAIVETYDPESGTYHITTTPTARDTNSATGLFGDNAAPATGLLAALRKLQLFVKSIGRQDMFKNDPVLSAGGTIGDRNVILRNICKVTLIFGGEFFILAVVFLTIHFLPIAMWSIQDLFFLSLIPSGLFGGMLWGSFTKADKIEGPVNAYAASECCEIHEIPDDTSTPCVPEKLLESSVMAFLLLKSGLNLLMFASVLSIWGSVALLCLNALGLSIGIVFSKHLLPDWVDLGMRVNTGCLLNRILSPQELNAHDIEYQEMNELKGFRGEVVNCSDEVRGERISIENDATQQKRHNEEPRERHFWVFRIAFRLHGFVQLRLCNMNSLFSMIYGLGVMYYSVSVYTAFLRSEVFHALSNPEEKQVFLSLLLSSGLWAVMVSLLSSFFVLISGIELDVKDTKHASGSKISALSWQLGGSYVSGLLLFVYFWRHHVRSMAHIEVSLKILYFWSFLSFFGILMSAITFFVSHYGARIVLNGIVKPMKGAKIL